MSSKKKIYADHSATTKVRAEVVETIVQILQDDFGNPSSIHSFGRKAKNYLNNARKEIATVINANEEQIFFTSGGTESNNIVISGLVKSFEEGRIKEKDKHIITTKIEHPSVKEPLEYLQRKLNWNISWINVDKEGFIDLNELKKTITPKTVLVSMIHANNEIGTVQDLKKISDLCLSNGVLFHSDIVQSFGKIPVNVEELNIDFLSMSAHKIYGPKGTGALYIKSLDKLTGLMIGGGQEKRIRPGTENIASIVGFGVAARLMHNELHENAVKLHRLQVDLMEGLSQVDNIILTGLSLEKLKRNLQIKRFLNRIPGHVSVCCKNIEGENLVLQMDLLGVAASSGSACSSGSLEPSHVLLALGIPNEYVRGSLRLTLGNENNLDDVNYIIEALKNVTNKLCKKSVLAK